MESSQGVQVEKTTTIQQTSKRIKLMSLCGNLMFWGGLALAIWGGEGAKVVGVLSLVSGAIMAIGAKISKWWNHS